jgi:hypothetical protein
MGFFDCFGGFPVNMCLGGMIVGSNMGVVVAILGRFSAFCPSTARGADHTHFLYNHLRLFAGEQFYPFISWWFLFREALLGFFLAG